MRTLAITQNITVDGSIEMLGDWFDPQAQGDADMSDVLERAIARTARPMPFSSGARRSSRSAATGRSSRTTRRASPTT